MPADATPIFTNGRESHRSADAENYGTKPCARRASSKFWVQGSKFRFCETKPTPNPNLETASRIAKRTQSTLRLFHAGRTEVRAPMKITKRSHPLGAAVQGSEFKVQSRGKLRNKANLMHRRFQDLRSLIASSSVVVDRRYRFFAKRSHCAQRAGSKFGVQGSKHSVSAPLRLCGERKMRNEAMGSKYWHPIERSASHDEACEEITKRSHALGAPVQSFGFKVQGCGNFAKQSQLETRNSKHGTVSEIAKRTQLETQNAKPGQRRLQDFTWITQLCLKTA